MEERKKVMKKQITLDSNLFQVKKTFPINIYCLFLSLSIQEHNKLVGQQLETQV